MCSSLASNRIRRGDVSARYPWKPVTICIGGGLYTDDKLLRGLELPTAIHRCQSTLDWARDYSEIRYRGLFPHRFRCEEPNWGSYVGFGPGGVGLRISSSPKLGKDI